MQNAFEFVLNFERSVFECIEFHRLNELKSSSLSAFSNEIDGENYICHVDARSDEHHMRQLFRKYHKLPEIVMDDGELLRIQDIFSLDSRV